MKKLVILSLTFIALYGCKNKTSETTSINLEANPDENMDMTIGELGIDCFAYEGNGSKVTLHITEVGEEVSGTLTYQLLEKDTNTGTFRGYFDDSILIADYTFLSEGVQSTREVAFQLQNNKLIEGYGEIEVDGSIARFKDMDDVKFTSTMPLSKIECPE